MSERLEIQKNAAEFAALAAIADSASRMAALGMDSESCTAALGMELTALADRITEAAGTLAESTGHSVEDVCVALAEGTA
jgi:hypothetical protein